MVSQAGTMQTDLDRLHRVVGGYISGPRCGKTVAHCHDIASAVELGEKGIYVVLPSQQRVDRFASVLVAVMQERGIFCNRPERNLVRCYRTPVVDRWNTLASIRIISKHEANDAIRGSHDGAVVCDSDNWYQELLGRHDGPLHDREYRTWDEVVWKRRSWECDE